MTRGFYSALIDTNMLPGSSWRVWRGTLTQRTGRALEAFSRCQGALAMQVLLSFVLFVLPFRLHVLLFERRHGGQRTGAGRGSWRRTTGAPRCSGAGTSTAAGASKTAAMGRSSALSNPGGVAACWCWCWCEQRGRMKSTYQSDADVLVCR